MNITDEMKQAGARALVNLGLLPTEFGADTIAETVFQEMIDARRLKPQPLATGFTLVGDPEPIGDQGV